MIVHMITLGITGTFGAGKGVVVEYLKSKGFKHYSVRAFLLEEIARRKIEPTRDSMHLVADDFRKISPGYIMEQLLLKQQQDKRNGILESVRALGEIEVLRNKAERFFLLGLTADPVIRYQRILRRKSSTDNVSFEKFMADEASEMNNSEPWQMNLKGCLDQADFVFKNEGKLEELYEKIDVTLDHILDQKQG